MSILPKFYEQAVLVIGFLGAVVFAAFIFLLGQKDQIVQLANQTYAAEIGPFYFQLLITDVAIQSILFIVSSIIMMDVSSQKHPSGRYARVGFRMFVIALTMLLIFIPLLLILFTLIGATVVFVVSMLSLYATMRAAEQK